MTKDDHGIIPFDPFDFPPVTCSVGRNQSRMTPEQEDTGPNSRQLSSFEKDTRRSEEYPLEPLDGRHSLDSDNHNEPLLPTSTPASSHKHRKCNCSRSGIVSWIKGPSHPHRYHIHPWLHDWQTAPERLLDRYFPSRWAKTWLLLGAVAAWAFIFISILHSAVKGVDIAGYGNPTKLSCASTLW